jgi:queuosine precursor transporter
MQTTNYKLFTYFGTFFAVNMVITGIIVQKMFNFYGLTFSAAILIFPISFILGDILTEVYGYKNTRKIIWAGFAAVLFTTIVTQIAIYLPPAAGYDNSHFEAIFATLPRIVFAGLLAYFCGEFANSVVLSKLKVKMQGQMLWVRTIGSTIVGEGIDTIMFFTVAFYGVIPTEILLSVMLSGYIFKVCYEIIATPLTYKIIAFVKKVEGVDQYDHRVKYNPFSID